MVVEKPGCWTKGTSSRVGRVSEVIGRGDESSGSSIAYS